MEALTTRAVLSLALSILMIAAPATASHVAAAGTPAGAITWTVDKANNTIKVVVKLEIYMGCSGDPAGDEGPRATACTAESSMTAGPTQFLADKIKKQIADVWNKGYKFNCYKLSFEVDIKLGTDRAHVAGDRIAVRIDPSPAGIRDYVNGTGGKNWRSDDPADKVVTGNDGDYETTWGERSVIDTTRTYAHEFGHVIGLSDAYDEVYDPKTKRTIAVPKPGAPIDLMSVGSSNITQETINRLVRRNIPVMKDTSGKPVTEDDLACDYTGDWGGRYLAGTLKYCGSTPSPYWGANIVNGAGDPAFVAYDIPEGSDGPVAGEIVTPFVVREFNKLLVGTGTFVPGDPPHFVVAIGDGTYIVTLKKGKFCDLPPL